MLDLGAGDGSLVRPLLDAGARVIAIELHPGRVQKLRERFGDTDGVQVVEHDLRDLRLPSRPFRVIANPPWSMAKPLLATLTAPRTRLVQADLVLQRGLVGDLDRRASPGTGSRRRFRARYARSIPRTAFQPAPPGSAALLRLTR